MDLDRGDADKDSAGVAVLWVVSWSFCFAEELSLSYQASGTDGEGRSSLALSAVGGSDDGAGVEEGTTAEMGAAALETDNEGEVAGCSGCSTNNLDRVLGSGSSRDCGGHEASNECLVLHLDEELGSEGSECWKRISEWMMVPERRFS